MKNDTRRYFQGAEIEKELIPSLMKLDKYFCSTRKYVLEKYNIKESNEMEVSKVKTILEKQTSNPMNYFRALESEKEKREFMQMIHRGVGI